MDADAADSRRDLKVALLQWSAGPRVADNLGRLEEWMAQAPCADLLALPETVAVRGSDDDLRLAAEPLSGPVVAWFADWARKRSVWMLIGSVPERDGDAVYNTAVLLDRSGRIVATYRKMHLFEACLPDGQMVRESDVYGPGAFPVMAAIEGWPGGLAICYDIRFPELFRTYAGQGAEWLAVPACFTRPTGRDHWEVLARARAIENQCFVIAPNQCGVNQATGIEGYGHSLVVGPWGEILAQAGASEAWISATLRHADLVSARRRLPALDHRILKLQTIGR